MQMPIARRQRGNGSAASLAPIGKDLSSSSSRKIASVVNVNINRYAICDEIVMIGISKARIDDPIVHQRCADADRNDAKAPAQRVKQRDARIQARVLRLAVHVQQMGR